MSTLYELKERLAMVGQELQAASKEVTAMAGNPSVPIEQVREQKAKVAELQERFDIIEARHDRLEAENKERMKRDGMAVAKDDKERTIAAKAAFYRAALLKQPIPEESASLLGAQATTMIAIPASEGTGGENLLPINMTNELIHEPWVTNPLRPIQRITNVNGLVVPKIAFALDSSAFVGDADTAKEISATGSRVTFGRYMSKVFCKIADTVVYGTDTNLVETIENALRSGLAAKEKLVTFRTDTAAGTDSTTEHMTLYEENGGGESTYVIDEITGEDLYEAITNAIADLHEDYRENATVVMKYADYVSILKTLANSAKDLFSAPPERVLGKPVVFCDSATIPVVGDFRYLHLNYENPVVYDSDKDVEAGDFVFVLTAWFDQRRLLNSAFRLAVVEAGEGEL